MSKVNSFIVPYPVTLVFANMGTKLPVLKSALQLNSAILKESALQNC